MKEYIDYVSTLFVGIDIVSRTHVICALDFHQEYFIKMKSAPNTQEGAVLLESMIEDLLKENLQFKYVIIGIDSFVIADFARVGRISIKSWCGSQYLALQRLSRHRMHITECITREKTYMLNNIFR